MRALVQGGRDTDDVDYTRVEEDAQKIYDVSFKNYNSYFSNHLPCILPKNHLTKTELGRAGHVL